MLAHLEGEARSSLPGLQSKEQVLRSLGILYGDIRSIMIRMTFAHQNLGKVPSCGVTRNHLIHLVSEHIRIIKGVEDLETEVMKEKT